MSAFVDAFLDQLADGGVAVDATRLRTVEQATAVARAFEDAPEGSRVVVFSASAVARRVFGRGLVQNVLASWDLTHVIETGGAYIPGQPLPTLILVGRAQEPSDDPVRVLRCHRAEPSKPEDPARGVVWSSVVANYDRPGHRDEWTRCADVPRSALGVHPWCFEELVP